MATKKLQKKLQKMKDAQNMKRLMKPDLQPAAASVCSDLC